MIGYTARLFESGSRVTPRAASLTGDTGVAANRTDLRAENPV